MEEKQTSNQIKKILTSPFPTILTQQLSRPSRLQYSDRGWRSILEHSHTKILSFVLPLAAR
jgi:hypothetical protein